MHSSDSEVEKIIFTYNTYSILEFRDCPLKEGYPLIVDFMKSRTALSIELYRRSLTTHSCLIPSGIIARCHVDRDIFHANM